MGNHDVEVLRKLAGRVAEAAEDPGMPARRKRLHDLNALRADRPVLLCFPEGAWAEILPDSVAECQDPQLRGWEMDLRRRLWTWENLRDDQTLEATFDLDYAIDLGHYGVPIPFRHGDDRGSYTWDPPLCDITRGLERLQKRQPSFDRDADHRNLARAQEVFDGLLTVRRRGGWGWTLGMTWKIIDLLGIEQLMLSMMDEPEEVHRLMAWMRDDHAAIMDWLEAEGLLTLNHRDHYVGSGGVGYTDELPKSPGAVTTRDVWGFAESQETVGISPAMFAEFIWPYQKPLLERCGLACYGCCEPVNARWSSISELGNLRRVSCSPWVDQEFMGPVLRGRAVFSRKPNPARVCLGFDDADVREDLRRTLAAADPRAVEIILKDTHTVEHRPERLTRWVQLALEEAEAMG